MMYGNSLCYQYSITPEKNALAYTFLSFITNDSNDSLSVTTHLQVQVTYKRPKKMFFSGTGKTVTGVHIAYWFAEQNKTKKSLKLLKKETSETECDGAHKSPPQVIYCGPSNKSVDVVTGGL